MSLKRTIALITLAGLLGGLWPVVTAHAQDESWLIGQVNALRADLGLSGLSSNGLLSAAAAGHSQYMATTCDIAHTESNGSTPSSRAAAAGYPGSRVNENIYGGAMAEASNAWTFWVNSGVHYQAMVDTRINEIGVGVASGPCGHFFTMLVGYNDGVSAPPAPEQAAAPAENAAQPADDAEVDSSAPATAIIIAPTQQPYVPPPPSRTPTATILTLTPSATWTITPTRTPSPTGTVQPPTSTPIVLPTVPLPGEKTTAVALAASPTTESSPSPTATPSPTELPPPVVKHAAAGSAFEPRDLLPVALAGQVMLIGVVGFVYFRRQQR
ncbi:MAG TPA: CAP domain-containing protein [Aggregatilinea sp.]|uniref:CAP domain-containing protein n=1 Tax=Aggregatilinea sp. TaxID=2806333 RepID=UPI002BD4BE6E|nr:CAP domain-containing protein [Aggregatilinea sp.]HML24221.1 CAP domain-containing protein [Aggregatilinea sp.]